jgi:uncharacterized protein YpmB
MKIIRNILILIIAIVSVVYYYSFVYSKQHHRNAQEETAIVISADSLTNAFQTNEQEANKKYLNKTLEVSGVLLSTNKDQAGHTTILIGKADAFSNVSVTLVTNESITQKIGETVSIKGICTGNLSDVVITDGVIK